MAARSSHRSFHATLSPEWDQKVLPARVDAWLRSSRVARAYAVAEKATKWHVHIVLVLPGKMRTDNVSRTIKSMLRAGEEGGRVWESASVHVDALVTASPEGIAAGYLGKDAKRKVLINKGFSDADMVLGKEEYEEGKIRRAMLTYKKSLTHLLPNMYTRMKAIASQYLQRQYNTTYVSEDATAELLIKMGFCFDDSIPSRVMAKMREVMWEDFKKKTKRAGDWDVSWEPEEAAAHSMMIASDTVEPEGASVEEEPAAAGAGTVEDPPIVPTEQEMDAFWAEELAEYERMKDAEEWARIGNQLAAIAAGGGIHAVEDTIIYPCDPPSGQKAKGYSMADKLDNVIYVDGSPAASDVDETESVKWTFDT